MRVEIVIWPDLPVRDHIVHACFMQLHQAQTQRETLGVEHGTAILIVETLVGHVGFFLEHYATFLAVVWIL